MKLILLLQLMDDGPIPALIIRILENMTTVSLYHMYVSIRHLEDMDTKQRLADSRYQFLQYNVYIYLIKYNIYGLISTIICKNYLDMPIERDRSWLSFILLCYDFLLPRNVFCICIFIHSLISRILLYGNEGCSN